MGSIGSAECDQIERKWINAKYKVNAKETEIVECLQTMPKYSVLDRMKCRYNELRKMIHDTEKKLEMIKKSGVSGLSPSSKRLRCAEETQNLSNYRELRSKLHDKIIQM